ncbi:hypothetical protein [Pseudomonas palmensis]|uniref:hypothetical protein n=1 Tax=Pseudomonas palmensis TaxID=2815362 RepID=UPI003CEAC0DA
MNDQRGVALHTICVQTLLECTKALLRSRRALRPANQEKQIAQMKMLIDRRVDGLVSLSQFCEEPEVRKLLCEGPPFVLLQRRSSKHQDHYVGADNREGISAAVAHLVELGHERIGCFVDFNG